MGESLKNFPDPGTTAGSDAALRREASGAAIEDTVSLSGHYLSLHGRPFTTFPASWHGAGIHAVPPHIGTRGRVRLPGPNKGEKNDHQSYVP
nr:MAG TPA: hypothetical protein [Caudoviricetes sp.]